ncbi:MAG: methyltransferase domain-containing protein [Magnetococcales bacterium]|nr:methyltransferase domain-containing protein [Magnetococcales bacterium]
MFDTEKALAILVCPHCRGELQPEGQPVTGLACRACSRVYPVVDGIPRMLVVDDPLLKEAKDHWEGSPHFQYEAHAELFTRDYFEEQDRWRANEVDPFSMEIYRFEEVRGKMTLDIGCGSGWVVKSFARHGAYSVGVDFTERAVISTAAALQTYRLPGMVVQADAQALPFRDGVFDRVSSIGVLHHIPDTQQGIREAWRVLKPGGNAIISLYGKLFFFNPWLFPLAQMVLKRLLKAPKVRDGIQHTANYDEFYRLMDGPTNPIGRYYGKEDFPRLFADFTITECTTSHFPLRFLMIGKIPVSRFVPRWLHRWIDLNFGMMRNCQLTKGTTRQA